MAEQPDRELIEQVLAGRVDAFNLLVWRWQRSLYNFLYRLTGDREQARDLAQETFLKAYTRLKDLRERDKFAAWLFRIAVNQHHSAWRSRPAEEAWDALPPEDADQPGLDFASRELRMTVRTLLGRLTPEQREVVLLKVYEGFRFEEISSILECPVSTVKSRLYAAFDQLRIGLNAKSAHVARA